TDVGEFVPLSIDRQGKVTREVAAARCSVPLPDHVGERLELRVALVRDLRRLASQRLRASTDGSSEVSAEGSSWLNDEWVATPTPPTPTEPALVPIVTTAREFDPVELARTYTHRWPVQENVIRDWLLPLGLDTNHGYTKKPVTNSEVAKKRIALEKRLANAKRWGEKARMASARAGKTADQRWKKAKARSREAYKKLNERLFELETEGMSDREYRSGMKELLAAVEEEMEGYWQNYYRAHDRNSREYERWQRYCREQCDLLREIEDLKAGERQMYELDDSKDQVMTALKLALANLAMWVRDNYFQPEYARATWTRLAPFFRLPGRVS
ncbi:MAG: hypothetical protein M3P51_01120, partial [Chloroflexota bacterium]|nr:hypothetical protein [Chloroflexota bacterium]